MKKPLRLSDNKSRVISRKKIEEIEILRKLDRSLEAEKVLVELLKQYPEHYYLKELAVYTYMDLAKWIEAKKFALDFAEIRKNDFRIHKVLGEIYYNLGDLSDAVASLNEYHKHELSDYHSYSLLGDILGIKGEKQESLLKYRKALDILQKEESVVLQKKFDEANLLWKIKEQQQAILLLNSLLKQYPDNQLIFQTLSDYYINLDVPQLDTAKAFLIKILEEDPDNAGVKRSLAYVYFQLEDYRVSELILNDLHKFSSGDYFSHHLLGNIMDIKLKPNAAKIEYLKALDFIYAQEKKGLSESIEEINILWKLKKKKEGLKKLKDLEKLYPNNEYVLSTGFYIYLDAGKLKRAKEIYQILSDMQMQPVLKKEMQLSLFIYERKWKKAEKLCEEILKLKDDSRYKKLYADILYNRRKWSLAKQIYKELLTTSVDNIQYLKAYRNLIEKGEREGVFSWKYYQKPQTHREHKIRQEAKIWLNSDLRIKAGLLEETFNKEGQTGFEEINEFVLTQYIEGKYYFADDLSLLARWNMYLHEENILNSIDIESNIYFNKWYSLLSYSYNNFVRDPIAAIDKKARKSRFSWLNRWQSSFGFVPGAQLDLEFYTVDADKNQVNGTGDLGYKSIYDLFIEYPILDKPYISGSYHFKKGYWYKEFELAENVVGYIPEEIVHYFTLHSEYSLSESIETVLRCSIGKDVKRNTDYKYSSLETNIWMNEDFKWKFIYEYNHGDSGTAGSGNSQSFNVSVNWYF